MDYKRSRLLKIEDKQTIKMTMKHILILGFLVISFTVFGQETVNITGKIIDAATGKKPIAVVTINEKGVGEYFVFDEISSNHHTIMDENGNFSIEIQKGGSLSFNPTGYFKKTELNNLTKSQYVEVELNYYQAPIINPDFDPALFDIGTKVYTVKGKVVDRTTGKGLKNVSVSELLLHNEQGNVRFTITDQNGDYSFTIHQGSTIDFDCIGCENKVVNDINSDQILNVAL